MAVYHIAVCKRYIFVVFVNSYLAKDPLAIVREGDIQDVFFAIFDPSNGQP